MIAMMPNWVPIEKPMHIAPIKHNTPSAVNTPLLISFPIPIEHLHLVIEKISVDPLSSPDRPPNINLVNTVVLCRL
jgi:hypothetical protein